MTSPRTSEAWKPASLPFTKRRDLLPTRLPTPAEIRASQAVIGQRSAQTIVAVTPDILVKYGRSTREREGQTLLFLEQCVPKVPAPRLYAMYHDSGELFVVMQRIPGVSLDQVWDCLSNEEKAALTVKLRTLFDDLRDVACPTPGYFGAVDGGPVPHPLFYCEAEGNDHITGPFHDEQSFNAALIAQYTRLKSMNNRQDFKTHFYAKHIDQVSFGHKPTLTHGDVQRKNVVLTELKPGEHQGHRAFAVTLVDWEDAGWYPDYWEYFVAFTAFRWGDDWCRRVEDIITPWPSETAFMKMVHGDLFF